MEGNQKFLRSPLQLFHPNVACPRYFCQQQHKANMLANQFALSSSCLNYPPRFVNVILPIQTQLLQNPMSHSTPIDPALNQAFSIEELLSAINDIKNTTPGPDNICYEMLKHMSIKTLEVMLQLFNNLVQRQNSSILTILHCCPYSQSMIMSFISHSPTSNSAAKQLIIFSVSMTQSESPWRTNTTFCLSLLT